MRPKTIYITASDKARLDWLLLFSDLFRERDRKALRKLNYDLSRARVVGAEQIPPDVVTPHSRVVLREVDAPHELAVTLAFPEAVTLVFPEDADEAQNRISVLTSIGTALLGCRTGDIIDHPVDGMTHKMMIQNICNSPHFQAPEPRHRTGND